MNVRHAEGQAEPSGEATERAMGVVSFLAELHHQGLIPNMAELIDVLCTVDKAGTEAELAAGVQLVEDVGAHLMVRRSLHTCLHCDVTHHAFGNWVSAIGMRTAHVNGSLPSSIGNAATATKILSFVTASNSNFR